MARFGEIRPVRRVELDPAAEIDRGAWWARIPSVRAVLDHGFREIRLSNNTGIAGHVFHTGEGLIIDDAIDALFFGVVESAYTPAKTELVDQRLLFRENIQW